MRYNEIIKEDIGYTGRGLEPETAEYYIKQFKQIAKDCQPYLKMVNEPDRLVRGIKMTGAAFGTKKVRMNDRTPRKMEPNKHKIINDYFTSKFGEPFRNSVMTIGYDSSNTDWNLDSRNDVTKFGAPNIMWPIGQLTFLWSPKVIDMNMMTTIPEDDDELVNWLEEMDYRNTDFEQALASRNEIMIRCDSYHIMDLSVIGSGDYDFGALRKGEILKIMKKIVK